MLFENAKKCSNILDILNQQVIKSNIETVVNKEPDCQSNTGDKKCINIVKPLFIEPILSATDFIVKNQSNTIICELQTSKENCELQFPFQNLTSEEESNNCNFNMFNEPKPNELQAFLKYHPIQVLDNENQTKVNIKKAFYRFDGTKRNWLSFSKNNNAFIVQYA